MAKKVLVIIPGLGDRKWLYSLIKPIWYALGFKSYIFKYGWNNSTLNNVTAHQNIIDFIDNIQCEQIYLLGASAGGTAAINIFTDRPLKIAKVVTICTPYSQVPNLNNHLIIASIDQLQSGLQSMSQQTKNKILAIYSRFDQTVPIKYSKPTDIKSKKISIPGHDLSIVFSLSILSSHIKRFFIKQ